MMYSLLKALHITALMTWVGGMLMQAFLLRTLARLPLPHMPDERSVLGAAVRWEQRFITPAMLLAWTCGLALASKGHWWMAPWLGVKLALVVGLSVLHGLQSGSLRRMAEQPARRPSALVRHAGPLVLGGAAAIVLLVVLKP
jgi:uncharacterized membrane protein